MKGLRQKLLNLISILLLFVPVIHLSEVSPVVPIPRVAAARTLAGQAPDILVEAILMGTARALHRLPDPWVMDAGLGN